MTRTVVPQYSRLVRENNRNQEQLRRLLGTDGFAVEHSSVLIRGRLDSYARSVCMRALLDLLSRLEPLIQEVGLDTANNASVIGDLPERFPVALEEAEHRKWDCTVSVGEFNGEDVLVDANGWNAYIGRLGPQPDKQNPIGPLAAACLAAGEVFKHLLLANFPDYPVSRRLVLARSLVFSTLTYRDREDDNPIDNFSIDATLVGAGGIGAGLVQALAEMPSMVEGRLRVVDNDVLKVENFNRHLYGRLSDLRTEPATPKVFAVARSLRACSRLSVEPVPMDFGSFKKRLNPRRAERRYPLVLTTVDNDEARKEVQLELPREILDGATGVHSNCRIERIDFVSSECLGCRIAEQPQAGIPENAVEVTAPEECGRIADAPAPSLPFLSTFPGVLLAGELLKTSLVPTYALRGYFEHIFLYPPNPDNTAIPAKSPKCTIQCAAPSMIQAYREKYPSGRSLP